MKHRKSFKWFAILKKKTPPLVGPYLSILSNTFWISENGILLLLAAYHFFGHLFDIIMNSDSMCIKMVNIIRRCARTH